MNVPSGRREVARVAIRAVPNGVSAPAARTAGVALDRSYSAFSAALDPYGTIELTIAATVSGIHSSE
jgi:hypothetical protein